MCMPPPHDLLFIVNKLDYIKDLQENMKPVDNLVFTFEEISLPNPDMNTLPEIIPSNKINTPTLQEDGFPSDLVQLQSETGKLDCPICQDLPRFPVTTPCGHVICRHCLKRSWEFEETRSKCNMCQKALQLKDVKLRDAVTTTSYSTIKVKCPFGCEFTGLVKDLGFHQNYICTSRPVTCPCFGCTESMPFHDLSRHYAICSFRKQPQMFKLPVQQEDDGFEAWLEEKLKPVFPPPLTRGHPIVGMTPLHQLQDVSTITTVRLTPVAHVPMITVAPNGDWWYTAGPNAATGPNVDGVQQHRTGNGTDPTVQPMPRALPAWMVAAWTNNQGPSANTRTPTHQDLHRDSQ